MNRIFDRFIEFTYCSTVWIGKVVILYW